MAAIKIIQNLDVDWVLWVENHGNVSEENSSIPMRYDGSETQDNMEHGWAKIC